MFQSHAKKQGGVTLIRRHEKYCLVATLEQVIG
jgi:hypothetical protein